MLSIHDATVCDDLSLPFESRRVRLRLCSSSGQTVEEDTFTLDVSGLAAALDPSDSGRMRRWGNSEGSRVPANPNSLFCHFNVPYLVRSCP